MGDKVSVEGDELYYEVRGAGPPLLMISGGQGDAGFYTYPAELLAGEYQVITYDRRGNSRSSRNVTNFSVAQQARDAVAVLNAVGHDSAAVFGNSGGAIIALELTATNPDAVTRVVAHEPPLLAAVSDHKSLALFRWIDRAAKLLGPKAAMAVFGLTVGIPVSAYHTIPADFTARTADNQAFFVRYEMQAFVNHEIDVPKLKSAGVPIVMAAGAVTLAADRYYGRPAKILAELLGAPFAVFPGHHLSYFDQPAAWTDALRTALTHGG